MPNAARSTEHGARARSEKELEIPSGDLTAEMRRVWNENADEWDARMGEGTPLFLEAVWPATERLLALRGGERVLDLACGNGVAARRMVSLGASVVAADFSLRMLRTAYRRESRGIEYSVLDLTEEEGLQNLVRKARARRGAGANRFDAVHVGMALMDVADIGPLFRAVPGLLRPGGRFVFSMMHPCFHNPSRVLMEAPAQTGAAVPGVFVHRYLEPFSQLGLSMPGLEPHFYFHRSIERLFAEGFKNQLVVTGLEEGTTRGANGEAEGEHALQDIPLVLVVRMERRARRA